MYLSKDKSKSVHSLKPPMKILAMYAGTKVTKEKKSVVTMYIL